jgi:hypothetical protein
MARPTDLELTSYISDASEALSGHRKQLLLNDFYVRDTQALKIDNRSEFWSLITDSVRELLPANFVNGTPKVAVRNEIRGEKLLPFRWVSSLWDKKLLEESVSRTNPHMYLKFTLPVRTPGRQVYNHVDVHQSDR